VVPAKAGTITTKVSVVGDPAKSALLRRMGPRFRGDDSGESLLHIFAGGDDSDWFVSKTPEHAGSRFRV